MDQKYRNRSGLSLGIQGQRSLTQADLVALSPEPAKRRRISQLKSAIP